MIKTIVSQQVSTSAARTIWSRLRPIIELHKKEDITEDILRTAGISKRKAAYILGILNNKLLKSHSKITRMFYICDEDIWLDGDLGINKAIDTFFPHINSDDLKEIYSPYRTYLSLYLWKGLDSL